MRKRIFTALRLLALCAFNLLHDLAGFQWLAPHLTSWGAAAFYLVKYSPSLGPLLTHVSRETCRFIGRLISCQFIGRLISCQFIGRLKFYLFGGHAQSPQPARRQLTSHKKSTQGGRTHRRGWPPLLATWAKKIKSIGRAWYNHGARLITALRPSPVLKEAIAIRVSALLVIIRHLAPLPSSVFAFLGVTEYWHWPWYMALLLIFPVFCLSLFQLALWVAVGHPLARLYHYLRSPMTNNKRKNNLLFITIIFLVINWFTHHMSYGFFTLLKFFIVAVSLYMIIMTIRRRQEAWAWAFGGIAILYNPFKVIVFDHALWDKIIILSALFMAIAIWRLRWYD